MVHSGDSAHGILQVLCIKIKYLIISLRSLTLQDQIRLKLIKENRLHLIENNEATHTYSLHVPSTTGH
jgi:hypothetical protein